MRVSRSLIELKEVTTNPAVGYYLAYKYSFNAELTNSELFSRGFTVPEADSEEEDISAQSTRGSQLDPLFIEDSDAESESWEPKDNGDVTMAQLDEEAGQHEAAIDDESDEDEEETSLASIADSDIESEAVSTGSAHSHGSDSPLFHGAQFIEDVEDVEKITATEQVEARPADQCQLTATLSAPTHPTPAEQASAAMPFYGEFGYSNVPDMPFSPNPVSQNVESTPFDMTFAPPLPPRPSQKLQRMWDEVLQEDYQEKWLAEGSHDAPVFPSANFSTHAPLYRDTSFRASQQIELPHISSFSPELVSTFKPAADRIQTPPPTLTADVVSSTPPLPHAGLVSPSLRSSMSSHQHPLRSIAASAALTMLSMRMLSTMTKRRLRLEPREQRAHPPRRPQHLLLKKALHIPSSRSRLCLIDRSRSPGLSSGKRCEQPV